MFRLLHTRLGHYLLLVTFSACLFLPGLGTASLWDIDEGHNANAAREMFEADDWVRPTFNYELRVDKPALLYWLQILGYQAFGVGEFAARLPSALAAILIVLLTYELGRRMFDPASGLIAGLVLPSALLFCGSAHFANPDALLVACNLLTFAAFWLAYRQEQPAWLALAGLAMGLGVLAKGPVAIVLPWTAVLAFAFWNRQFRWFLQFRWLLVGGLLFVIVAAPWYALVGSVTKGEFLRGFFLQHNVSRFQTAMEGHSGPVFYHLISLLIGFLPWSAFLVPALWYGVKEARDSESPASAPTRFLLCWLAVYLVFFSISSTKLPNYILPLYPAAALLTARFLERWRQGCYPLTLPRGEGRGQPPGWLIPGSLIGWGCFGVGASIVLLIASGVLPLAWLRGHAFPDLQTGAALGLLLVIGAAAAWMLHRRQPTAALGVLTGSAALFVGIVFAWGAPALDRYKPCRALALAADFQPDQDARVGCYAWYQPSLVFYCQRKVYHLGDEQKALEFLQYPIPVYLFLPASVWQDLRSRTEVPCRLLARHWDLYRNCEVVVVTNR